MVMPGREYASVEYKYAFNGVEHEEGISESYNFGERMLESRLGRWFSRDPYESTYPSISSYGFSLCNPIVFGDNGGNWVTITLTFDQQTHQPIITINISGSIVDNSGTGLSDETMLKRVENYSRELNRVLNNFEKVNRSGMKVVVNMDFQVAHQASDIDPNDHVIHFVDNEDYEKIQGLDVAANVNYIGGKEVFIPLKSARSNATIAHEFAHLLGLRHVFGRNEPDIQKFHEYYQNKQGIIDNLMHYEAGGDKIAPVQILMMYEFAIIGMLNRGSNSFDVGKETIDPADPGGDYYASDPWDAEKTETAVTQISSDLKKSSEHLANARPLRTLADIWPDSNTPGNGE